MKNIVYSYPKSSFLSIEKDLDLIVNMIMKNSNLKKMLHYSTKDCLSQPNLTEDETLELFGKNVKIVPKAYIDGSLKTYIIIALDGFLPTYDNPQFRENEIEFDIICHFDQWPLKDFQLRPYRIAAELDSMLNNKHLSGIGTLEFIGAHLEIMSENYTNLCIRYRAVHGEEDKKNMLNPRDQEQFVENYNQMFNN